MISVLFSNHSGEYKPPKEVSELVQKFKPQRKDDEVRIKMDITVDLPAELAEQAEQMGI